MKNTLASELPRYWSSQPDGQGGVLLCYAVREGALRWALIAIGLALVAGGIRFAFWLMQGGVGFEDLTLPFLLILTLGSGGLLLAGAFVLDQMLWARTEYAFSPSVMTARKVSIFGVKTQTIPRDFVLGVSQQFTPGGRGDWVTFVEWRTLEGQRDDFAFDGMNTLEERDWLGALLAEWAKKPVRRGFSASHEEANPAELPD